MGEVRLIGGTDIGARAGVPVEGDHSAGSGPAPATGSLSSLPHLGEAISTPDAIRSILADVPRPRRSEATVWGASGSAQIVDDGAVRLKGLDHSLPQEVARAGHAGSVFTLLLARPGPAAGAASPLPPVTAGAVADLAASLSVSLDREQELYSAGPGYLAVVLPGRAGAGRREAMRLTRRAAAADAPPFTWAAAQYPRDATTAAGLLEVATNRLDGRLVSRTDYAAAPERERSASRSGAAIWGGVAAAVLLGALFFGLHGSGAAPHGSTGTQSPGQTGSDASGSGIQPPSSNGPGATGAGTGSGRSPSGSGSTSGPSAGGAATGSGPTGSGGPQPGSSGSSPATTTVASDTTTTSAPCNGVVQGLTCTVNGVVGQVGGALSTATTVAAGTTTTTAPCTGVVQNLTCTVNGAAGKVGGKLGL